MKQNPKPYHRENLAYWFDKLPPVDLLLTWDRFTAAYHVRRTIERMEIKLSAVRIWRDTNSWLYDVNQLLALSRAIRGERELLHELTHSTH